MEPPSSSEKRLRFACGLILGLIVGAWIAFRYLGKHENYALLTLLFVGLGFGYLAMIYGDRFWHAVGDAAKGWMWWR